LRTIAIASGKGGVGKTTLAANIGVALAELGQNVVIFDADLGLANLDVVFGTESDVSLQHAVDGYVRLTDAVIEGRAGVRLVVGSSGVGAMLRLSRKRLEAFLAQVHDFSATTDVFLFDASAGADARVMTFLKAADQTLLVTTPDPASIVDCYSTAKVLFRCKPDACVSVLANQVRDQAEAGRVMDTVSKAAGEFLRKTVGHAGFVRADETVTKMSRRRGLFVLDAPTSAASRDVRSVASALIEMPGETARRKAA